MTVRYFIDKQQKTVFTTLSDTLTMTESVEHHHKLGADPDFDPAYKELMDMSELDNISLNISGIASLAKSCPFRPESNRAIYSTNKNLYFGLARMFQALTGGNHGDIRVFRKLDEALEWLEVIEPDSQQCRPVSGLQKNGRN